MHTKESVRRLHLLPRVYYYITSLTSSASCLVVLHILAYFQDALESLVGSIHILIALGPISFMEIGTLVTNGTGRRKPGLNDIYAVPL
jgi:hypothetical protein